MLTYDLRKPYKMIVSESGKTVIQNGFVYEYGSGRKLGTVANVIQPSSKELLQCKFSGATFPNTPDGKIALEAYQDRRGYTQKAKVLPEDVPASREERLAEIKKDKEPSYKPKGAKKEK